MGPYPHDAPPAEISVANPAGTDGFEFVEFSHPEPTKLADLFARMGFARVARHRRKAISVYRQGEINFLVNAEAGSFASRFMRAHGPCVPAMAWRVADAGHALRHAVSLGAEEYSSGDKTLDVPAIVGIGGSLLYFVDRDRSKSSFYTGEFEWVPERAQKPAGKLDSLYLDHLTHNVSRGNLNKWFDFYSRLFNFRQIRFFNIEGRMSGLCSRALTSPCGKIRIPINESADAHSQIEEYLQTYKGEGIQHIAIATEDIYGSVEALAGNGVRFMPSPPDIYYARASERVPGHQEPVEALRRHGILIDGEGVVEGGMTKVLLQIFSKTVIGPIFFEFIQRKGDDGFGEGNFRALFESIEEDQIRRGVLKPARAG